jgi:hypothetical protein
VLDIRAVTETDREACRGLWTELVQHHRDLYQDQSIGGEHPGLEFDEHLKREDLRGLWVAVENGTVIGLVGLLMNGDEAQIEPIIVTMARRDAGIGGQLLSHARNEAIRREARFLSIMPVARNVRAVRKFIASGFGIVGQIDLVEDLRPGERAWLPNFDPGTPLRY